MKVLIIDDNAIVVEGCRQVLEAENIEVVSSPSVTDALQILELGGFGLLLMDIIMPEKDGFYMMDEVQRRWPDLPVIVMSGYPVPEVIERARRAGAARFVSKPFTPDELLSAVRSVLHL